MTDETIKQYAESFMSLVKKTETCWYWLGATAQRNPDRYGYLNVKDGPKARSKMVYAHRFSYALHRGPLIKGLTIDHLCKETLCVNPDHLEQVTQAENTRRAVIKIRGWPVRGGNTYCRRGHLIDAENIQYKWHKGRHIRLCKTCNTEWSRKWYLANKERILKRQKKRRNKSPSESA